MRLLKKSLIKCSLFLVALLSISTSAFAGPPVFFSWGGETIEKIADFPRTSEFQNGKNHIDPGIRYKQIEIFFLPIYQYDFKYCGVIEGQKDSYLDLSKNDLDDLAKDAHINIPNTIDLGFWKEWGGRIILVLISIIYFGYAHFSKKLESESKKGD